MHFEGREKVWGEEGVSEERISSFGTDGIDGVCVVEEDGEGRGGGGRMVERAAVEAVAVEGAVVGAGACADVPGASGVLEAMLNCFVETDLNAFVD